MSSLADIVYMRHDSWRDRLTAAITKSGKSLRAVSLEAGLGPGYVHSILKDDKDPTIDRLLAVCDAVPVSPIHVLLGVEAAPDDVTILRELHANPTARAGILAILRGPAGSQSDE